MSQSESFSISSRTSGVDLTVGNDGKADIVFPHLDDRQLPVLLEDGPLDVLNALDAHGPQLHLQFKGLDARTQAGFGLKFPLLDEDDRLAVDEDANVTADGFQVLQGHDQNRPDDHDHEKLKDADRIVINDAADNTTEDVVLYLVQGRRRRQIAFA